MPSHMRGVVEQLSISNGGVPKHAILHARVNQLGIEGDKHAHPRFHAGPRQALLMITAEGIDELKSEGFGVYAGALGENLTTSGLDRRAMRIGQRYRAGSVLLELTKMRQPCATLNPYGQGIQEAMFDGAVKRGDFNSPLWGLGGFYASVIEAGDIVPGDIIALVD
jgi:MOSC domain-containing protein YiiM